MTHPSGMPRFNSLSRRNISLNNPANQIAEASRFVLSIGKQAFYAQVDQSDSDAMDFAKQTMIMSLAAEDAQEGIMAFMEKRAPVWKNK